MISGHNFGNNAAYGFLESVASIIGHLYPNLPPLSLLLAAFILSSGTVGAALSGALSQKRSISISFGVRSTPQKYLPSAYALSARIIKRLWDNWGSDAAGLRSNEVDLYNVNLPLADELLRPGGMEVCWTKIWCKSYAKLFKPQNGPQQETSRAGPGAETESQSANSHDASVPPTSSLLFTWSPEKIKYHAGPPPAEVAHGTDTWAVRSAKASVTPLRATFAAGGEGDEAVAGGVWQW
ncbi:hypothetical protein BDV93DRAFT_560661 [Ceratobasidium sp. AG-I]|nr:hypothetical protein BDV93DRAFT_560661 [Ceratobasidium sp. AG-I]